MQLSGVIILNYENNSSETGLVNWLIIFLESHTGAVKTQVGDKLE